MTRFDTEAVDGAIWSCLYDDLCSGLIHHLRDAPTWPAGWVRWTNPLPYRTHLLLRCGLLEAGSPEEGATSVHVSILGKAFAQRHIPEREI